jgi:hypothetical protein
VPVDEAGGARGGRDAEAFLDPHACGLGQCERLPRRRGGEGRGADTYRCEGGFAARWWTAGPRESWLSWG